MKGTVFKRGSKWSVVIDAGRDATGKRIRKWHSGFATKREAETARVELLSAVQNGVYTPPNKVTVAEWLDRWLAGRTRLSETTRVQYGYDANRIKRVLGSVRLRDLTRNTLNDFYAGMTAQGLSPSTVRNAHAVIRKACNDAVRDGVLARNPAIYCELPEHERPDTETWTADQLATFLRHVSSHRLYAAWVLACSTGMRRSELLGMRWRNVNLERGTAAVVDTLVLVRNKPVFRTGETKSRRSRRVVALDGATVAVLKEHKKRQNEERLRAGTAWENLDLVFSDELGGVVHPDTFTRTTKRLATEAGVPPLTPHPAARHTWATLALESGVHPKVVQERLGHSSISLTMDRYSHVTEGMDRDAAETVAKLIGGRK